jgi:hypothetical protein
MYCNGGADTDKWGDAQIGHYIGIGKGYSVTSLYLEQLSWILRSDYVNHNLWSTYSCR